MHLETTRRPGRRNRRRSFWNSFTGFEIIAATVAIIIVILVNV